MPVHLRWILIPLLLLALLAACVPQPTPNLTPLNEQISHHPVACSHAEARTRRQIPDGGQGGVSQNPSFEIPAHPLDAILGRPTDTSITFSLLAYNDQTVSIAYGTESGDPTSKTEAIPLKANTPQTFLLSSLQPDTQYYYSINGGSENTFHTARATGSTFTFTLQADSHLDSNTDPQVYLQTLANQRADHPDFIIDLGDTFMTEKYKPYTGAAPQYLAQRYFFGQLADTAPLFFVLGNHDGEGAPRGKDGEEISIWAAQMRTKYFPNPAPDGFYTGNTLPQPAVGDLQDYYAFTWGDALFIVLDPYWFTPSQGGNTTDLWNPTLGNAQYQWLKSTLESSNAKWKFVFIHQLIGGLDKDGRGGVEIAPYHEWGGLNPDGSWGFDENRPGWGMSIHQLLVANHVNAVFHGHDHLFVRQEMDGITYQEVPQPGSARADNTNSAADYGYLSGDILGGIGHLRVTVSPEQVTVEYICTSLSSSQNGQVVFRYSILP